MALWSLEHLLDTLTEDNEVPNILACLCAGIETSFSFRQFVPEFLIRATIFHKKWLCKNYEEEEGKEAVGWALQEEQSRSSQTSWQTQEKGRGALINVEGQIYEDMSGGFGGVETEPPSPPVWI